jgi:hypothetical protein
MSTLVEAVEEAKTSFVQAKDRLIHGLNTTPDDRLNWSPSPSSRTPIQIVAHAANSVKHIHDMLDGRVFHIPTTAEAEKFHRSNEKAYTTREAVLELLEANGSAYLEWLDAMTPDQFGATAEMPFKLGFMPVSTAIGAQAQHMTWHAAQLDYIQTIYGDQDWHIGV